MAKDAARLFYHVENPCRQPWSDMLHEAGKLLGLPIAKDISFTQWIDQFEANEELMSDSTARELMPFFRGDFTRLGMGVIAMDTQHASCASPSLNTFGPVTAHLLDKYIGHLKTTTSA